jgi:membrane associated rhomboid family serine protease
MFGSVRKSQGQIVNHDAHPSAVLTLALLRRGAQSGLGAERGNEGCIFSAEGLSFAALCVVKEVDGLLRSQAMRGGQSAEIAFCSEPPVGGSGSHMGIYDRDYVRRQGPSFLGSFTERGQVCKWLVGINVAFFIIQILPGGEWFTNALDLDAHRVLHGEIWRLLTYAFLHQPDAIFHILFNMLFLWWFGSDVEDLYGPREFLIFYLSACLAGGLLFFFTALTWLPGQPCIGASGGVLAVLTLCAIHYPRRTILLFFILPVPLWLFLIFAVALDAHAFLTQAQSGTAVAAHLGGVLFAGVYYRLHWRLSALLPQFQQWRRQLSRPRLRVYREEEERAPVPTPVAAAPPEDERLEEQMDAILEKISRVGKENLTDHERDVLLRASEIYRRRRH